MAQKSITGPGTDNSNLIDATTAEEGYFWLMRIASPFRIRWDLFVMALATWNCFSIPFIVAFTPELSSNPVILYLNYLIDVIFFLDIVLNFRTTYFSGKTGDEIYDPRKIARNYLGGKFLIQNIKK